MQWGSAGAPHAPWGTLIRKEAGRHAGGRRGGAACEDSGVTTYATLHTTQGDIRIELFPNHAPKTVRNFVGLADGSQEWTDPKTGQKRSDSLYAGTVFHRVINGFMIQGGDPLGTGTGGPGYHFGDEFHPELRFDRPYLLAMANAGPGTNGSQFFITVTQHAAPQQEAHDLRRGGRRREPRRRRRHRHDRDRSDGPSRHRRRHRVRNGRGCRRLIRARRPGCRSATGTPTARPTSAAGTATGRSARTA